MPIQYKGKNIYPLQFQNKVIRAVYFQGKKCFGKKKVDYTASMNVSSIEQGTTVSVTISLNNGGKFAKIGTLVKSNDKINIYNVAINGSGNLTFNITGVSIGNVNLTLTGFTDTSGNEIVITNTISLSVFTYVIEKLTASGTWVKPAGVSQIDILVIGGGGGGSFSSVSGYGGAAGGAGGAVYIENYDITKYSSSIAYIIGIAGIGAYQNSSGQGYNGTSGGNSTFGNLTAIGGGYANTTGGCGGGSSSSATGPTSTQPTTNDGYENSGYGNAGGGRPNSNSNGAGGGIGGVGSDSVTTWGGSGAGMTFLGFYVGEGGGVYSTNPTSREANTGHGGHGRIGYAGGGNRAGIDAGSGAVIIRYKKTQ